MKNVHQIDFDLNTLDNTMPPLKQYTFSNQQEQEEMNKWMLLKKQYQSMADPEIWNQSSSEYQISQTHELLPKQQQLQQNNQSEILKFLKDSPNNTSRQQVQDSSQQQTIKQNPKNLTEVMTPQSKFSELSTLKKQQGNSRVDPECQEKQVNPLVLNLNLEKFNTSVKKSYTHQDLSSKEQNSAQSFKQLQLQQHSEPPQQQQKQQQQQQQHIIQHESSFKKINSNNNSNTQSQRNMPLTSQILHGGELDIQNLRIQLENTYQAVQDLKEQMQKNEQAEQISEDSKNIDPLKEKLYFMEERLMLLKYIEELHKTNKTQSTQLSDCNIVIQKMASTVVNLKNQKQSENNIKYLESELEQLKTLLQNEQRQRESLQNKLEFQQSQFEASMNEANQSQNQLLEQLNALKSKNEELEKEKQQQNAAFLILQQQIQQQQQPKFLQPQFPNEMHPHFSQQIVQGQIPQQQSQKLESMAGSNHLNQIKNFWLLSQSNFQDSHQQQQHQEQLPTQPQHYSFNNSTSQLVFGQSQSGLLNQMPNASSIIISNNNSNSNRHTQNSPQMTAAQELIAVNNTGRFQMNNKDGTVHQSRSKSREKIFMSKFTSSDLDQNEEQDFLDIPEDLVTTSIMQKFTPMMIDQTTKKEQIQEPMSSSQFLNKIKESINNRLAINKQPGSSNIVGTVDIVGNNIPNIAGSYSNRDNQNQEPETENYNNEMVSEATATAAAQTHTKAIINKKGTEGCISCNGSSEKRPASTNQAYLDNTLKATSHLNLPKMWQQQLLQQNYQQFSPQRQPQYFQANNSQKQIQMEKDKEQENILSEYRVLQEQKQQFIQPPQLAQEAMDKHQLNLQKLQGMIQTIKNEQASLKKDPLLLNKNQNNNQLNLLYKN